MYIPVLVLSADTGVHKARLILLSQCCDIVNVLRKQQPAPFLSLEV